MAIIREAVLEDVKTMHVLGERVGEFDTSDLIVTFWPEDILRASVNNEAVIMLVAVQPDGAIVGFIIVNCNRPLSKALIENIYVRPDMRKQGIATALVKAAIGKVNDMGYEFMSVLTSPEDLPAIHTYEAAGFARGNEFLWLDLISSERFRK